ncbi:MAG TPA: hypothetical protein VLV29_08905 [Steroidobacteraceae bacterium]|nr:hypothetical protein [Steroidobacteraceae bacterium]
MADAPPEAPPPSVYEEPPVSQPAPVVVAWAPPPMLVEVPPPMPFEGAVWVGGYWVWRGNWVWASGRWMGPPQPAYVWVHPYYEHRAGAVIFIDGHWAPPGVVFVPPPRNLPIVYARPAYGVVPGPRPIGPEGCFVPPPPGSRRGIIVPAPVGTAPAVVTGAPPVIAPGMRVTANVVNVNNGHVTNITNVTKVTNVTIVAPAGATANGHAYTGSVPAAPHLAAARPAVVPARAPEPAFNHPVAPLAPAANGYAAHVPPRESPVTPEPQPQGHAVPPGHAQFPERAEPPGEAVPPGAPHPVSTSNYRTQNSATPHAAPPPAATHVSGNPHAPANSPPPAAAHSANNGAGSAAKPVKPESPHKHDPEGQQQR